MPDIPSSRPLVSMIQYFLSSSVLARKSGEIYEYLLVSVYWMQNPNCSGNSLSKGGDIFRLIKKSGNQRVFILIGAGRIIEHRFGGIRIF